jgi:hypothetical protein
MVSSDPLFFNKLCLVPLSCCPKLNNEVVLVYPFNEFAAGNFSDILIVLSVAHDPRTCRRQWHSST